MNIRKHRLTDERNKVKEVKYRDGTIRDCGFTFKRLATISVQMRYTCIMNDPNISPRTYVQINDGYK